MQKTLSGRVGIFFVAKGKLLLHTCSVDEGLPYGDFINYPKSHDEVWERRYQHRYHVDFDYFPRGRIVFNCVMNAYMIFYDTCVAEITHELSQRYAKLDVKCSHDEHYQCHECNSEYENIFR